MASYIVNVVDMFSVWKLKKNILPKIWTAHAAFAYIASKRKCIDYGGY